MNKKEVKITYESIQILGILKELDYILCSLHYMGSYYLEKDKASYEKETMDFIDNSLVCVRLAHIRKILTEQFDTEEGEDGLDDIKHTIDEYIVEEEIYNEIELCAESRFVCGNEK